MSKKNCTYFLNELKSARETPRNERKGSDFVPIQMIDGTGKWHGYYVNGELDGLWDWDYKQLEGTCDFTLRRNTVESTLRAARKLLKG